MKQTAEQKDLRKAVKLLSELMDIIEDLPAGIDLVTPEQVSRIEKLTDKYLNNY